MIFVHDKGRMCNNILQYAHLYAWGREHHRTTMSMRFAYKYQYFHICHTPYHRFLNYAFAKYAAKLKLIPTVTFNEDGAPTDQQEQVMLHRRLVMAEGWYVRYYDLFLKYKPEILQLFDFLPEVKTSVAERFAKAERENEGDGVAVLSPSERRDRVLRVGVHIRRGDYKTFNGGKFFYTDEQYVKVIKNFLNLIQTNLNKEGRVDSSVAIYICGNDPTLDKDYYRQQLSTLNGPLSIETPSLSFPDGNPGEDLCLLSQCDYLIGPPSTFTLVASMYHDTPLCWLIDINEPITFDSFNHFDYLFRHII